MRPTALALQANGTANPIEDGLDSFGVPFPGVVADAAIFVVVLAGVYLVGRLFVGPRFARVADARGLDLDTVEGLTESADI